MTVRSRHAHQEEPGWAVCCWLEAPHFLLISVALVCSSASQPWLGGGRLANPEAAQIGICGRVRPGVEWGAAGLGFCSFGPGQPDPLQAFFPQNNNGE